MSRVMKNTFNKDAWKLLNTTIKQAKDVLVKRLKHHSLNIELLNMLACADSSLANYDDSVMKLGYNILPEDDTHTVNWISNGRYKCRQIMRSILRGENRAFVNCVNIAFA